VDGGSISLCDKMATTTTNPVKSPWSGQVRGYTDLTTISQGEQLILSMNVEQSTPCTSRIGLEGV